MLCLGLSTVVHVMTRLNWETLYVLFLGLGTVLHDMTRLGKSFTCYD